MTRIGGIVLAAGASRRAGGCKALAELGAETFVERTARALRGGGCTDVVVVVGPPHGAAIAAQITGVSILFNDEPARGMLSSLKIALDFGVSNAWDAAVVALVDQPNVRARTVQALALAWLRSEADVVRPRFADRTGHPYLISRAIFQRLRDAPDAGGARPILRSVAGALDVDVDDRAVLEDLDDRAALAAAGARMR